MVPQSDTLETLTTERLCQLAEAAWNVREQSYVVGPTKVGCAVLSSDGTTFVGCNVEHKFRSHDVHAEVNAITTMVAGGGRELKAVVIVAERRQFTPCGACMDWIMQFGGGECLVAFQSGRNAPFAFYRARELMPFYPN